MNYFLQSGDFFVFHFYIVYAAMIALIVFFLRRNGGKKRVEIIMTVAGLDKLVAPIHYDYMRNFWVVKQATLIVYRYID